MRLRPVNEHEREGEQRVKKLSSDSLLVGGRKFTFDSVLDSRSKQVLLLHKSCFTSSFYPVMIILIVLFACQENVEK